MDKIIIYGIPNCDSTKKALDWLKKEKVNFEFHDYKKSGITKPKLEAWCKKKGVDVILNKKSTTWRGLSNKEQEKATDPKTTTMLMIRHTSVIKRPVIEFGDELLVGFDEKVYKEFLFNSNK
jgi:arsenate reductase